MSTPKSPLRFRLSSFSSFPLCLYGTADCGVPAVHPPNDMSIREITNEMRKRIFSEINPPHRYLYTTNPVWTVLGLKPDIFCEKPATDRLSHGAAN